MKVLITGHRGEIGNIIFTRLQQSLYLHTVTGYDILDGDDINDENKLRERISQVEAVIHLAGLGGPRPGAEPEHFDINLPLLQKVAEVANEVEIQRFVYPSSDGVYGTTRRLLKPSRFPIPETTHIPKGMHPYAISKVECERWLRQFSKTSVMKILVPRLWPPVRDKDQRDLTFRLSDHWCYGFAYWSDIVLAFHLSLTAKVRRKYSLFHIASPWTPTVIDLQAFLAEHWEKVPNRTTGQETPVDISRAQKYIGYHTEFKRAKSSK